MPSLQAKGLHKFFFFPGFSAQTGGLLREADLLDRRRAFQSSPTARVQFLQGLGVEIAPTERLMSLFGYENSALPSWLDCLASDTEATLLLVNPFFALPGTNDQGVAVIREYGLFPFIPSIAWQFNF